jgi:hypothetical protein
VDPAVEAFLRAVYEMSCARDRGAVSDEQALLAVAGAAMALNVCMADVHRKMIDLAAEQTARTLARLAGAHGPRGGVA